ncbi:brachyurin-like [Episyrphus balteatus]|uniref:brachyurin-like n=1 Tax=Episyrphus balteatus TaxID=286459 RepID=UPI0024859857|nr:brachyurin-like [Episyrphus balteatus]
MISFIVFTLFVHFLGAEEIVDWKNVPPRNVDDRITANPNIDEVSSEQQGRITNGKVAEPKQFPYQVGLLLYGDEGKSWCGGTLISEQWIISAAHCAEGVNSADVYLGATNRTDRSEAGQQIVKVEKDNIIVHEAWDRERLLNDISLFKLPNALELSDYIKPAKLPESGDTSTYQGKKAIASGWGRDSDSARGASEVLRWIEVPIMANNLCGIYYMGNIKDTNICINTRGRKSTCNGDSGGPLVLADGSDTLIGATSFGIVFGCEVQFPGVFTRITSYLDWINEKTGDSKNE